MTTDIPRTAVGNARGMSRRVSSHLLPLKSLRTMIQAMGRPTTMSIRVTMKAMLNEFQTAPSMTDIASGSSRTPLTRSHSVNTLVTTKMAGTTMRLMKSATANASQALRTLYPADRSSSFFINDNGITQSSTNGCGLHGTARLSNFLRSRRSS